MYAQPDLEDRQVSPKLYTREYYSHVQGYQDWDATHGRRLPPRLARAVRLARIRPGHRCLDVGTGRGEVVFHAAMAGAEAVGIDYSDSSLDIAREALGSYPDEVRNRCTFVAMDSRKLAYDDAHFDRIFMLDLVEHLYPEGLAQTLVEAHRVLKPGGLLIVHTEPNRNYAALAVRAFQSPRLGRLVRPLTRALTGSAVPFSPYRQAMHVNEQSPDSLTAVLNQAGFRARVWCSGIYGFEELREWRSVLKRVALSGWPLTSIGPLAKTFGINVWAVAER
jgi:ubiquinone/menaquinone biosynthesis C-methylase UbiE